MGYGWQGSPLGAGLTSTHVPCTLPNHAHVSPPLNSQTQAPTTTQPDLADGLSQGLQGAWVVLHEGHMQFVLSTLRQGRYHCIGLFQQCTVLPIPGFVSDQLLR
jgi:hypothetical protein